jgi:hypothetical protein
MLELGGRRISEEISKPETSLDKITNIIDSKSKSAEGIDNIVPLMRELVLNYRTPLDLGYSSILFLTEG